MIPTFLLNLLLSFSAFQTFIIVGSVRDQAGQAIPNVRVSIFDENFQPIRTIFVDSSGRFTVRGLGSGRYSFRVETTGTPFEEQTQNVELYSVRVRPGGTETLPLDFVLKPIKSKGSAISTTTLIFAQEVPANAKSQFDSAVNYLKNGDTQQGIAALKKAVELFPNYFDALELLGTEYVKSGQFNLAIQILARAYEVNHRAPKCLYALGVAQLNLGHYNEAVEALKKSGELAPTNSNVPMMLGMAYNRLGNLEESETAYKKALQMGGKAMADAHFYLAGIYEKQGRYAEAAQQLELYLKEASDIKDPEQIKVMIERLNEKAKGKPKP